MVQLAGELVGPMKWLIPRYTEKPGSIMRLGSILTDPENLESSLNLHNINEIPEKDKRDVSLAVKRYVETELSKSNSLLVRAAPSIPALTARASVGGNWSHNTRTTVDALNVRATVFIPTKTYMDGALEIDDVVAYARKGLFGRRLYIIVGTATASKLSIKQSRSRKWGADLSATFVAPTIEGGILHEGEADFGSELGVAEECDFAYRVREFSYSKVFGISDKGDCTEKAMFDLGYGKSAAQAPTEATPQFEWLEEEDVLAQGLVTLSMPIEAEQ